MVLILDIETKTFDGIDPAKDELRFIGAYDTDTGQEYFYDYTQREEIKKLISSNRYIVTFNGDYYDIPILKRQGLYIHRHVSIDLREIIKKRSIMLRCTNESMSLANMAKFFGLEEKKIEDFDYSLLQKEQYTEDEKQKIKEYTMQDIKTTANMFEYLSKFFESFKDGMSDYDMKMYKWLTASPSVYAYKYICHQLGIAEEYAENTIHKTFDGGFVAMPEQEEAHGNIYCLDFNSLYPHIMIQSNLFSHKCKCCTEEEKWKGNDMFPIKGRYCSKRLGKTESLIQNIYNRRVLYKKAKDKRELSLKLIINILYGLTGNPVFKQLYHYDSAQDCTLIGRECTKYARERLLKAGYIILYSDTDSVYLQDPFNDKERMIMVKDDIIAQIKKNLPFPVDTFDMGIDEEIEHIWFVKKDNHFLKKHYIYVTKQGKVKIKGLSLIKRDSSVIGYEVYKRFLESEVRKGTLKTSYEKLKEYAYQVMSENMKYVCRKFTVNAANTYKNSNDIHAQVARTYGIGKHRLIPNNKIGVGISVKYCTQDEFIKHNLKLDDVNLSKYWKEMKIFCDEMPEKKFFRIEKQKQRNQQSLTQWSNI